MIIALEMALLGFVLGVVATLFTVRRLRLRWMAKANARARALGEEIIVHQCGPVCRECLDEGYPVWLCEWLA